MTQGPRRCRPFPRKVLDAGGAGRRRGGVRPGRGPGAGPGVGTEPGPGSGPGVGTEPGPGSEPEDAGLAGCHGGRPAPEADPDGFLPALP
ncbi:hypothetical protein EH183_41585 [Streptomyces sp. CB01881]|nr:hypothetical protein EH183_41585 [Streptomyces sp. CB01881]